VKTNNISSEMSALSNIEPLTDYFMNNINDNEIFDEQSTLFNLFKIFLTFWTNGRNIYS